MFVIKRGDGSHTVEALSQAFNKMRPKRREMQIGIVALRHKEPGTGRENNQGGQIQSGGSGKTSWRERHPT